MTARLITLAGRRVPVPKNIQRIDTDHNHTHGWQVRHAGTKFVSDRGAGGPQASLTRACFEMHRRKAARP